MAAVPPYILHQSSRRWLPRGHAYPSVSIHAYLLEDAESWEGEAVRVGATVFRVGTGLLAAMRQDGALHGKDSPDPLVRRLTQAADDALVPLLDYVTELRKRGAFYKAGEATTRVERLSRAIIEIRERSRPHG